MGVRSPNFYYPFDFARLSYLFPPDKTTGQVFTAPDPSQNQNGSTITWQTTEKIWNQGNLLKSIYNKTVRT